MGLALDRRRARLDVGQPLQYGTRWRKSPTGEGTWVVDRAFNTQAISAASMGPKAVQNCEVNGADQVELSLRPSPSRYGYLIITPSPVLARSSSSCGPTPRVRRSTARASMCWHGTRSRLHAKITLTVWRRCDGIRG